MERNNCRYKLDFSIVPRAVKNLGPEFVRALREQGGRYLCDIFNNYYEKVGNPIFYKDAPRHFTEGEFSVTERELPSGLKILYVTLPHEHEGSLVYCTAYAFACLEEDGEITAFMMFTIEKSVGDTTCIAQMWDGDRKPLGPAMGSVDGDIEFLGRILKVGDGE